MNTRVFSKLLILALLIAFVGCEPGGPDSVTVTLDSEFTGNDPVVAVGNSLTAGFLNGGLIQSGQMQGYANMVARQLTGAPALGMSIPLVAAPGIGSSSGYSLLYVTATGALTRDALTVDPTSLLIAGALLRPYGNLGVPGAVAADALLRTEATPPEPLSFLPANPFFDMILRNGVMPFGDATQLDQLDQIVASAYSDPKLLMLWLGNNDILGGATSGDPVANVNVFPLANFQATMAGIVARVNATSIPMVALGNIPEITSAPYFTAIRGALAAQEIPVGAVNTDEADVQFILLPAQAVLFNADGSPNLDYFEGGASSLPSTATLTSAEVSVLADAVGDYNTEIAAIASANGWALADISSELASLPTTPPAALAELNGLFPFLPGLGQNTFSAFSLDGIHPSEKGYARTANVFIDALNAQYAGLLTAVLGGPIPNVNEAAVTNVLGFEVWNATVTRGTATMTMTPEAVQALKELPFGR